MPRICALCAKEIPQGEVGFMIGGLMAYLPDQPIPQQVVLHFHLDCVKRMLGDLVTALIPKNMQ